MLVDYSKFGITAMNHVMDTDRISVLITGRTAPADTLDAFRAKGIEVCTAPPLSPAHG